MGGGGGAEFGKRVTWGAGERRGGRMWGRGRLGEFQGPAYMSGVSPEHLGHQGGVHVLLHKGEGNKFSSFNT